VAGVAGAAVATPGWSTVAAAPTPAAAAVVLSRVRRETFEFSLLVI